MASRIVFLFDWHGVAGRHVNPFFGDYGRRGDSPWDAGLGEDRARGTIQVVLMDWEAGGLLVLACI